MQKKNLNVSINNVEMYSKVVAGVNFAENWGNQDKGFDYGVIIACNKGHNTNISIQWMKDGFPMDSNSYKVSKTDVANGDNYFNRYEENTITDAVISFVGEQHPVMFNTSIDNWNAAIEHSINRIIDVRENGGTIDNAIDQLMKEKKELISFAS